MNLSSEELAREVFHAAQDVKAEDITVLDLQGLANFTDFFVIANGRSDRQVQAIADRIQERLREHETKLKPIGVEGYDTGHWILIDFGGVIAHVFYGEVREFYELEKLWSDAPQLDWTEQEAAS